MHPPAMEQPLPAKRRKIVGEDVQPMAPQLRTSNRVRNMHPAVAALLPSFSAHGQSEAGSAGAPAGAAHNATTGGRRQLHSHPLLLPVDGSQGGGCNPAHEQEQHEEEAEEKEEEQQQLRRRSARQAGRGKASCCPAPGHQVKRTERASGWTS